jgi:hypothetical protein
MVFTLKLKIERNKTKERNKTMNETNKQEQGGWIKAGVAVVDSGMLWLGDPCYILPDKENKNKFSYEEFCSGLDDSKGQVKQWDFKRGGAGMGVSFHIGDGVFNVYRKNNELGGLREVRFVNMMDDEEEGTRGKEEETGKEEGEGSMAEQLIKEMFSNISEVIDEFYGE